MRFIDRLAAVLLSLALALPPAVAPAFANDLGNTSWSELDGSNNAASPNGWASGTMLPSQVEPTARAMMGAIKRWYDQDNATLTSGGTANAQTLTYTAAPAALVTGQCFTWTAGASNSGDTTLNVNGLGAVHIRRNGAGTALVGGEIVTGDIERTCYDGTNFQLSASSRIGGGFTAGSVIFSNGSNFAQDNADLFWNATNHRLGIGTAGPLFPFSLTQTYTGSASTTQAGLAANRLMFAIAAGDDVADGSIDYRGYDAGALSIVGAGANGSRHVRIFDELGVNAAANSAYAINAGGDVNTTGVFRVGGSQIACGSLSNAAASCATDATNASNISSGTLSTARLLTTGTGNVALANAPHLTSVTIDSGGLGVTAGSITAPNDLILSGLIDLHSPGANILSVRDATNSGDADLTASRLSAATIASAGSTALCESNGAYEVGYLGITACSSDARLKQDIRSLSSPRALWRLLRLTPRFFVWRSDDQGLTHAGFIAQELQRVFPEAVFQNPDGYYTFESNAVLALLARAAQILLLWNALLTGGLGALLLLLWRSRRSMRRLDARVARLEATAK